MNFYCEQKKRSDWIQGVLANTCVDLVLEISEDDYYTKSTEFRLWLRRAKKKYFEEMTADETRRYFKKFVKAWNNFDLDGNGTKKKENESNTLFFAKSTLRRPCSRPVFKTFSHYLLRIILQGHPLIADLEQGLDQVQVGLCEKDWQGGPEPSRQCARLDRHHDQHPLRERGQPPDWRFYRIEPGWW